MNSSVNSYRAWSSLPETLWMIFISSKSARFRYIELWVSRDPRFNNSGTVAGRPNCSRRSTSCRRPAVYTRPDLRSC